MRPTPRASRPGRITVVLAASLALVTLTGCTDVVVPPAESASGSTATKAAAGEVWDASLVHSFSVKTDEADYRALIEAYEQSEDKVWIKATVTIDGTVYENVGLKLKGNSTLRTLSGRSTSTGSALSSSDPAALPWIIRLDKYTKGQTHAGSTEFVVRGNSSQTSLNEAFALDLLAETGLAAEPAIAVHFSMNGSAEQLRLVVENPSDEWMERTLGDGLLYKAEAGGDYSYRGADASAYADIFDQEAGDDDMTPLIEFLRWINEASDSDFAAGLADRFDVEAFATYLAFQDLVDNFDDIDGPGNNSYLYYDPATQRMTVVNWDLNLAFGLRPGGGNGAGAPGGQQQGGGPRGGAPGEGQAPGVNGAGPGGQGASRSNILRARFVAVPAFKALYDAAAVKLRSDLVDSGIAAKLLEARTRVLQQGAADLVDATVITRESSALATKLGI